MAIGKVINTNSKRGMVVVHLEGGSYSVLEILGYSDIEINTAIQGDIDEEGSCEITNIDTDTTIDIVVQCSGCNLNQAMK